MADIAAQRKMVDRLDDRFRASSAALALLYFYRGLDEDRKEERDAPVLDQQRSADRFGKIADQPQCEAETERRSAGPVALGTVAWVEKSRFGKALDRLGTVERETKHRPIAAMDGLHPCRDGFVGPSQT